MPADPPAPLEPPSEARALHGPRPAVQPTSVQRRLVTVATGLALAVLAGGAFVLTYDLLREFAIAGRAGERWAAAYPVMADALVVIVVLALIVARDRPWWSRWIRGALLLALLAGTAAIAVQHAVWGFGSLPQNPVRVGVAVAPHVMLVIAVWLWYRMIRHFRPASRRRPEPASETAPAPQPVAGEPVPEPLPGPPPLRLPTDVEVARAPGAEGPAPSGSVAETTRPDIVMPVTLDEPVTPDEATDVATAETDGIDTSGDLPIWDWDPPSGSYRSSPTPPEHEDEDEDEHEHEHDKD